MTKIERIQAFRAPDGNLYENHSECRAAVLTAVVEEAVTSRLYETTREGITDFISRGLDEIIAKVDKIMGSV